jgi:hypothetical protein
VLNLLENIEVFYLIFKLFLIIYSFEDKCFDIRFGFSYISQKMIKVFANREEIPQQPGYDAMLYAFKCKQLPYFGIDPDVNKFKLHKVCFMFF